MIHVDENNDEMFCAQCYMWSTFLTFWSDFLARQVHLPLDRHLDLLLRCFAEDLEGVELVCRPLNIGSIKHGDG